eukprot:s645_g16.t1
MHAYFSNGISGQELGCWWRHVHTHAAVTLLQLSQYAALWNRCPNSPAAKQLAPQNFVDEKLWQIDGDFRGECAAPALVLVLCISFSEEVLADVTSVQTAIFSLIALYNVICVLAEAKRNPTASRVLLAKQQMHMKCFAEACSTQCMRPKALERGELFGCDPASASAERCLGALRDRVNSQGAFPQQPALHQDREVVEDGDLKSVLIQLPSSPSPQGRDASLEAGDVIIQLEPLVGDVSKNARSWW